MTNMLNLDRELTHRRQQFYSELRTKLDVEAGLAEVFLSERHREFTAELRTRLDVEAGLAAIVPLPPQGTKLGDDATRGSVAWSNERLAAMPLQDRLSLRALFAPTLGNLARTTLLLVDAPEVPESFRDHLQTTLLDRVKQPETRTYGQRVDERLEVLLELFATERKAGPSPQPLYPDFDIADPADADLGVYILQAKGSTHRSQPSQEDMPSLAVFRSVTSRRWLVGVLQGIDEKASAIVKQSGSSKSRTTESVLVQRLAAHLEALEQQLNDFIGTDLRNVNLAGLPLEGLRWSIESTRWPENWAEQIKHDSVHLGDGIYEIHYGSHTSPNQTASV
ncbi:hypothetical protein [Nocardia beijingensis]